MKKILLGSSVLVSAAALFAGAAVANDTPTITLGGYSDFQVGHVTENRDAGLRDGSFYQETELSVSVDAKTDGGLGYGAYMDIDVSNTVDQDNANDQVGKSYVYLEGAWGRVEGGSNYGVTKTMKIDASSIARASGGIDGNFNSFLSTGPSTAAANGVVVATPDLLLDYGTTRFGDESAEAINKINYYTPRFAGFQAGVSYLFDTTGADRGTGLSRTDTTAGEAENVFLGGINYEGAFEDITLGLAATGEWGQTEAVDGGATEDLASWNIGGKIGYMGVTLAGSYGDWGGSLQTTAIATHTESSYWTAGISYETGPFGASLTYLNSTTETINPSDNKFENWSVGVDYALAPGLTPYVEASFINMSVPGMTGAIHNDNNATVLIAGTQLAF